jgi:hypothetical protein
LQEDLVEVSTFGSAITGYIDLLGVLPPPAL